MAIANKKAPPVFDEAEDYLGWENDMEIWGMFTSLEKKRGPAVYLSLTGRLRGAVRDLTIAEIGSDDGLHIIIQKLDGLFLQDDSTRA